MWTLPGCISYGTVLLSMSRIRGRGGLFGGLVGKLVVAKTKRESFVIMQREGRGLRMAAERAKEKDERDNNSHHVQIMIIRTFSSIGAALQR